ncbi:hypothetical protein JHN59_40050 [Streptomyces sp. MBT49]|uniref:hypothetical protein n=1 Tax=unclassified Streptomyces TaxID=2593676 RepID=UPI00190D334D|nr:MULTISPECIES: hypothetical protein [unclassified Streptomyces]MBK3630880.1 hypothetical protein [Streptomyces sp. MBT49]MBK3638171.1 hypothetical protein [Streptomyces sp. MBT97]
MTPGERWVQRVMGQLGVRPVGHGEPLDDDENGPAVPVAPVVPIQPPAPAPDWPPLATRRVSSAAGPGRLPAPGETIALGDDDEERPKEPVEDEDHIDEELVKDEGQDDEEDKPVAPPTPSGPVAKVPAGAKPVRKKMPRPWSRGGSEDDPAPRIAAFNLTAAAVGYGTPLAGIVDAYLVAAEQAARGVFAFVLAAAAVVGTWWVTGRPGVREILACLPYWPLIRLGACLGLAEVARRMAPVPIAWLNGHGEKWGLGPNAVSLLITSGGICFTLWWFIDRKLRRFHWLVRWMFRVPLATAVVASLSHGNPIH